MPKIYLIRHGETDWNRHARLQGNIDVQLNERGIQQARELSRRLQKLRIGQAFTSPLLRARQTAGIATSMQACPVSVSDDLREIDHGVWSGMRMKTIEKRFPDEVATWRCQPDRLRIKEGETLQEVYARATRFLSNLLRSAIDRDVLVVGHGVTNSLILCAGAAMPIGKMDAFAQPNGSVAVLHSRRGKIVAIEALQNESVG